MLISLASQIILYLTSRLIDQYDIMIKDPLIVIRDTAGSIKGSVANIEIQVSLVLRDPSCNISAITVQEIAAET